MVVALVQTPLGLGGDTLSGSNIAIAVVSLFSIVAGYLLLAGLWYFVFRERPQDTQAERSTGDRPAAAKSVVAPAKGRLQNGDSSKLERRLGPRFRRR